jgi:F-type H+-transporting ATPase subunit c
VKVLDELRQFVCLEYSALPHGVAVFSGDPGVRRIAEREHNVVHWSEFDRGGHFAAMEVPGLHVDDIRGHPTPVPRSTSIRHPYQTIRSLRGPVPDRAHHRQPGPQRACLLHVNQSERGSCVCRSSSIAGLAGEYGNLATSEGITLMSDAPVLVVAEVKGHIAAIAFGVATVGPGIAIGLIFGLGCLAIARQPELTNVIRQHMILGFAMAEALALIAFVVPFVYANLD